MTKSAKADLTTTGLLPDFRKPPVVETSLGFYFPPLSGWSFVHVGALWQEFKDKYPKAEYRPPINVPGDAQKLIAEIFADVGKIPFRTCLVDKSNTQLVQLQNSCFFHNWRKTADTPQYQHYGTVKPFFQNDWETFCRFLVKNSLQVPDVSRCEVTYFNHLVRGEDWQDMSEFSTMFPSCRVTEAEGMLSKIETANISVSYELGDGKFGVSVSPGVRQTDGKEVIVLTITGSSTPKGSTDDLFQHLDLCHRNAVLGFARFTSEDLKKKWERML
jgi:uncharacterized protein (TIGR04255 family)